MPGVFGQKVAEFLRKIEQDRAAFEHPAFRLGVKKCGNFRIRIDGNEAR
jgi:hypothetical protein